MANIKDYIIDLSNEVTKTNSTKTINKSSINYSIVLENNTDFIINRKSAKTDKDLVFLTSQDLFYIKDNKTNSTLQLTKENIKRQLGVFMRDMEKWITFEKVTWTKNSNSNNIYDFFVNDNKRILFKYGFDKVVNTYRCSEYIYYINQNLKLFRYYYNAFNGNIHLDSLKSIFDIYKDFDYNNAVYLIDCMKDLGLTDLGNYFSKVFKISNIEYDTHSMIKYLTYGLYSQGITTVNYDIYNNYIDYINMTYGMYGDVKDKYPKSLKTQHDKIVFKYNLFIRYKKDLAIFKQTEEHQKLAYSYKDYSVILPSNSSEIIDEGMNQSNCVASYINKVVQGDTLILFMRNNKFINDSLVTIEVKSDKVVQVKGYANRGTTSEEDKFINKWAKDKKLKIAYK